MSKTILVMTLTLCVLDIAERYKRTTARQSYILAKKAIAKNANAPRPRRYNSSFKRRRRRWLTVRFYNNNNNNNNNICNVLYYIRYIVRVLRTQYTYIITTSWLLLLLLYGRKNLVAPHLRYFRKRHTSAALWYSSSCTNARRVTLYYLYLHSIILLYCVYVYTEQARMIRILAFPRVVLLIGPVVWHGGGGRIVRTLKKIV